MSNLLRGHFIAIYQYFQRMSIKCNGLFLLCLSSSPSPFNDCHRTTSYNNLQHCTISNYGTFCSFLEVKNGTQERFVIDPSTALSTFDMKLLRQFEDELLKTNEDVVPQICETFQGFALWGGGGGAILCPPPYKRNRPFAGSHSRGTKPLYW